MLMKPEPKNSTDPQPDVRYIQCPSCKGHGVLDPYCLAIVECEDCKGRGYKREEVETRQGGKIQPMADHGGFRNEAAVDVEASPP